MSEVLVDVVDNLELLEVGEQGPPGPQGPTSGESESGPAMTYTGGALTRVDYDSGNYKLFSYTGGVLTQLDYVKGATTFRSTFNYNPDGTLASVDKVVL